MILGYTMVLIGSSLLIGAANLPDVTGTEKYILISLAASVVASSTAFLTNDRERFALTVGRALFSGVVGVVLPVVGAYFSDSVARLLSLNVITVFGASFVSAFVAFILSIPFIHWLKRRAPRIVSWGDKYIPTEKEFVDPKDIRHAAGGDRPKRRKP